MKRMNKMLLVAALAATTLSVQAEQKKGPAWLSDALFYQIYPSSFMDTDGNGIGERRCVHGRTSTILRPS